MVDAKSYVEYLDKEMTIMGILSVFCVSAAALIANAVIAFDLSKTPQKLPLSDQLWIVGGDYILAGMACLLAAALAFYLQRSLLAWHYGELCLTQIKEQSKLYERLDDAHSWATWIRYRWGFVLVTLGFVYLAIPLLKFRGIVAPSSDRRWIILLAVLALAYIVPETIVIRLFEHADSPWRSLLEKLGVISHGE